MGRKTATVTIGDDGERDQGKVFVITELPAAQAEKWGLRFILALGRAGVPIPEELASQGIAGVAVFGLFSMTRMSFVDAEPLVDEMMTCVAVQPDRANPEVKRPLVDTDTEEIRTRIKLREEVFKLHTGFSAAAFLSKWMAAAAAKKQEISPTT